MSNYEQHTRMVEDLRRTIGPGVLKRLGTHIGVGAVGGGAVEAMPSDDRKKKKNRITSIFRGAAAGAGFGGLTGAFHGQLFKEKINRKISKLHSDYYDDLAKAKARSKTHEERHKKWEENFHKNWKNPFEEESKKWHSEHEKIWSDTKDNFKKRAEESKREQQEDFDRTFGSKSSYQSRQKPIHEFAKEQTGVDIKSKKDLLKWYREKAMAHHPDRHQNSPKSVIKEHEDKFKAAAKIKDAIEKHQDFNKLAARKSKKDSDIEDRSTKNLLVAGLGIVPLSSISSQGMLLASGAAFRNAKDNINMSDIDKIMKKVHSDGSVRILSKHEFKDHVKPGGEALLHAAENNSFFVARNALSERQLHWKDGEKGKIVHGLTDSKASGSILAHEIGHSDRKGIAGKVLGSLPSRAVIGVTSKVIPLTLLSSIYGSKQGYYGNKEFAKENPKIKKALEITGGVGLTGVGLLLAEEARASLNARSYLKKFGKSPKGLTAAFGTYLADTLAAPVMAGGTMYGFGKLQRIGDNAEKNAAIKQEGLYADPGYIKVQKKYNDGNLEDKFQFHAYKRALDRAIYNYHSKQG